MDSLMETREKKKLSTSQHPAITRLTEKREKDKRFVKNWQTLNIKLLL